MIPDLKHCLQNRRATGVDTWPRGPARACDWGRPSVWWACSSGPASLPPAASRISGSPYTAIKYVPYFWPKFKDFYYPDFFLTLERSCYQWKRRIVQDTRWIRITMMQIRIRLFTSMGIRILKLMRIQIRILGLKHWKIFEKLSCRTFLNTGSMHEYKYHHHHMPPRNTFIDFDTVFFNNLR